MFLSLLVGIGSGIVAVVLFNLVDFIQKLLKFGITKESFNFLYLVYPIVGISLTLIFIKYILRQRIGHGIPGILYAISKNQAYIKAHNMFSPLISSALTVGFGGSVGLEGPSVASGGALGSNLGRMFRLSFKYKVLLIGCGSAAAMAAIFKAPIAGIVFAFEVMMLDLTTSSIIPILIASASATLTSYVFLGQDVIYQFDLKNKFLVADLPYYIALGVLTGLISVYFSRVYLYIGRLFDKLKRPLVKLLIGGSILGVLILFFPALYGDGYEAINLALKGESYYLFEYSFFNPYHDSLLIALILLVAIIMLKVIASSVTFGAGGVGGIFAPSLFTGANVGLLFASFLKYVGVDNVSSRNFALVGMAGLLAGVLHAPLTGLFLIADITSGYALFMPLMITATLSYATIKYFETNSVYTIQLAKRKALLTHHADKNALVLMKVDKLIETNFKTVDKDATLGDLVKVIAQSVRNIFPVVDKNGYFIGVVNLDDIRQIVFQHELYDKMYVKELMTVPSTHVTPDESMDDVARKIQQSGRFNIVVLQDGKYLGFVSRANVFSNYRKILKSFSAD
ncbi:MAG: chloride channel protein [Bacteroidales bacterium]|nr:chloride channel protein [Bacteroidales bacterium]